MSKRKVSIAESRDRRNVGRRLRKIRTSIGLSQEKFAAVLDISLSVYGKYERGDRELPRHVQVRIMRQTDHDPFNLDAPIPSLQALKDQAKQPIASISLVRHIRAVLRARKLIVADRIAYHQNVISKSTSRRNEFFEAVFWFSTFFVNYRNSAIRFGFPMDEYIKHNETVFFISGSLMILILPIRVYAFSQFVTWRRAKLTK